MSIEHTRSCPVCNGNVVFDMQPPDYCCGLLGWGAIYWKEASEHAKDCTWDQTPSNIEIFEEKVMQEYE